MSKSLLLTSCRVLVLNYDYIAGDRGRTNGPIPSGYHVGVSLLNKYVHIPATSLFRVLDPSCDQGMSYDDHRPYTGCWRHASRSMSNQLQHGGIRSTTLGIVECCMGCTITTCGGGDHGCPRTAILVPRVADRPRVARKLRRRTRGSHHRTTTRHCGPHGYSIPQDVRLSYFCPPKLVLCRSRQRIMESCRTTAPYYTCRCAPVALIDCMRTVMPPAVARRPCMLSLPASRTGRLVSYRVRMLAVSRLKLRVSVEPPVRAIVLP